MLACDEQHTPKTLIKKRSGFVTHFVDRKRDPQDRILARKTAVAAGIDTFVRDVKWRKQANHFAETLLGNCLRAAAEQLEMFLRYRRNQMREIGQAQAGSMKALFNLASICPRSC